MRLFVAVYPPASARDDLAEAVGRLRGTVGRVPAARWHVTLAFLGEVAEERVTDATAALTAGVAGWRARGASSPRLRCAGSGRFGQGPRTVLWVGLAGDVPSLRALTTGVRQELRRAQLPYDRKPLRPHLTIARPGDRLPEPDLTADLAALAGYEGPDWLVDAVHLVNSRRGPTLVYDQLVSVPLVGPAPV